MKFKDITGQKFGKLTPIRRTGTNKHRNTMWECECECGNIVTVAGSGLHSGNTQSCGCLSIGRRNKDLPAPKEKLITNHTDFRKKVVDSYDLPKIIKLRSKRRLIDIVPNINTNRPKDREIIEKWKRYFTEIKTPWAATETNKYQTLWKERRA